MADVRIVEDACVVTLVDSLDANTSKLYLAKLLTCLTAPIRRKGKRLAVNLKVKARGWQDDGFSCGYFAWFGVWHAAHKEPTGGSVTAVKPPTSWKQLIWGILQSERDSVCISLEESDICAMHDTSQPRRQKACDDLLAQVTSQLQAQPTPGGSATRPKKKTKTAMQVNTLVMRYSYVFIYCRVDVTCVCTSIFQCMYCRDQE